MNYDSFTEVQAPIDDEPEELVKNLSLVRGRVDGVTVSEIEIDGVVGDTIKTCEILQENRFKSIYQTTTREKNRIQLQKDLISAHEAGWKTSWCLQKTTALQETAFRK